MNRISKKNLRCDIFPWYRFPVFESMRIALSKLITILSALFFIMINESFSQVFSDSAHSSPTMTLSNLVRETLTNNAGIGASAKQVEAAASGLKAARGQRFPQFKVFGSYESFPFEDKLITPRHMDIPVPPFTQVEMTQFFNNLFDSQIANAGVLVNWQIYTGGKLSAVVELNENSEKGARYAFQQKKNDVIFMVTEAYYRVLQTKKIIEANEKTVENLEESKRVVGRLLEVGKTTNVNLLRINTRLALANQRLIKIRSKLKRLYGILNSLMGRPVNQELEIEGKLDFQVSEIDLDSEITKALHNSPELLVVESHLGVQESRLRMAKAERFPQVKLMGMYKSAYGVNRSRQRTDGALVLNVSFPLYTWGVVGSKVEQQKAKVEAVNRKLSAFKQKVSLYVYLAYLDLQEAYELVEATEVGDLEAKEALRIERLRLEQGKGVVNDVLDAQADQLNAEVNFYRALADYKIALLKIRKASGELEQL